MNAQTRRQLLMGWIKKYNPIICWLEETLLKHSNIGGRSKIMEHIMQIVLKGKQVTIFISKKFNCKENPWERGSVEQERERSRHDKSVNPSEKNVENFCGYAPSNRDEKKCKSKSDRNERRNRDIYIWLKLKILALLSKQLMGQLESDSAITRSSRMLLITRMQPKFIENAMKRRWRHILFMCITEYTLLPTIKQPRQIYRNWNHTRQCSLPTVGLN